MKKIKVAKFLLPAIMILSWLTLPLLGKENIKRFLPTSILMSTLVAWEGRVARKRKWWWFFVKVHPKLPGGFPLEWGPFLIGSMWILRFTYGKFLLYMLLNLLIDTLFTYPFVRLLQNLRIATLVRLKKYQLSMLFFVKSLILYGLQMIREKFGRGQY
jgi:hypothetical protein